MRPAKDEVLAFLKPDPPTDEEQAGGHGYGDVLERVQSIIRI